MEQSNSEYTAPYSYRNLDIWKRARILQKEIITIVKGLPREIPAEVAAKQIMRSSSSIAANVAEGHGRFSYAAFRNHLLIARGSATETDNWLATLLDAQYIDEATEVRLHRDCDILIGALTNRIRSLGKQLNSPKRQIREQPGEYTTPRESARPGDELFDCSNVPLFDEEDDHDV